MKKLLLAFTLLAGATGTALADDVVDPTLRDHRVDRRADQRPGFDRRPAPAPTPSHGRWSLIDTERASGRRGILSIALPRMARYDQLRLVPTDRDLEILAVEITYARGATSVLEPQRDGAITIDLANQRVRSINVRYANRGRSRGASVKVLGQAQQVTRYDRDRRM